MATSDQPSGTITFLFSDIEGSTRLLEELGDGYVRFCRSITASSER
jgi:class 3 adenylate cyclase